MSQEPKKPDLLDVIKANLQVSRQDIENPHKKQEAIVIPHPANIEDSEEDENTAAKSLIDEIIEETESED